MEILQPLVAILVLIGLAFVAARWGVDSDSPANTSSDGRAVRWAIRPALIFWLLYAAGCSVFTASFTLSALARPLAQA